MRLHGPGDGRLPGREVGLQPLRRAGALTQVGDEGVVPVEGPVLDAEGVLLDAALAVVALPVGLVAREGLGVDRVIGVTPAAITARVVVGVFETVINGSKIGDPYEGKV
ncbi:hypothetical protein [Spongiactinospora gelatinilytica]|uniref:hypothetical protein n=1 Tax=Spongiactinospora gelatinilytica TaxID=2666298 RepID=UPI0011B94B37|nr:hypothetical protein [Spongiactinospora gelatinilytica]